ncbi:hypothetical protein GO599_04660 [Sulfolobus islandicus]|uniref:Uncharacterized protein n=1 Tax=Saccharolobus islandicus (strain HVE10/4) TaxID=930943 RepID=F0NJF0_SACI0|nr:hypothetical protein [Sulfolobus islandicus]ADX81815.1 hypothetical protein SiH_0450 [Sulfolobus islandicus HVE10/4]WCM36828.1 hypothetical protein GO599_04660 [Sulfolobus islandicus]
MNYLWFYIIVLGLGLLVINLFVISYPPFTIFSLGLISTGIAAYGVNIGHKKDDKVELLMDSLYRNLELIFRYYNSDSYYRIFIPSSIGSNGILLLDKFPVRIENVKEELINKFNNGIGIFLETPGSIIVKEMRKKGINFSEDLEFLLRKALVELYNFGDNVEVNFNDQKSVNVKIHNPDPNKAYSIIGYIQTLIVASIIAEKTSKITYVKSENRSLSILNIDIGILE